MYIYTAQPPHRLKGFLSPLAVQFSALSSKSSLLSTSIPFFSPVLVFNNPPSSLFLLELGGAAHLLFLAGSFTTLSPANCMPRGGRKKQ
jgi:hypothetical protein